MTKNDGVLMPSDGLSAPLAVKTRKAREKAKYILHRGVEDNDDNVGDEEWKEIIGDLPDAAAAKKHVRDARLEGSFRVVRVCCTFTAATETRMVTKRS